VVLQGPKLLRKLLLDATVKHPEVMESTNSPVGLANDKYGPVNTIILMYREKCSQKDLDLITKRFSDDRMHIWNNWSNQGSYVDPRYLLHQTSYRLTPSRPYEETETLLCETMVSLSPVRHITER
jgi:hypothetical protein